jgi:hypothetical protein
MVRRMKSSTGVAGISPEADEIRAKCDELGLNYAANRSVPTVDGQRRPGATPLVAALMRDTIYSASYPLVISAYQILDTWQSPPDAARWCSTTMKEMAMRRQLRQSGSLSWKHGRSRRKSRPPVVGGEHCGHLEVARGSV